MPSRIDHVIIAAPDLALLEETFTRLGFSVVGGGVHPHLGTRNRIIILGEGYIELLALADATHASAVLRERIALGGGWVGYALQSDDIAAEALAMRARGVDVRGPSRGSLVAPNGARRGWQVVTIGSDDLWAAALPLPFLIQHDSSGARHQQELAGADNLTPHTNAVTRIVGVTLRATDLAALRERYEQAYALTPTVGGPHRSADLAGVTYALGDTGEWVHLAQPANAPVQVGLATGDDFAMSVRVSAPDLAAVEHAIWHAGLAVTRHSDALSVIIPGTTAELQFTALP